MVEISNIERINMLVDELNHHRNLYYNLNAPDITDSEYDQLFDKLKALEDETGIRLSNSPTQTVGYEVISKFAKVEHKIPLLSLDKTKSIDELAEFMGDKKSLLMLKNDGLTVKLEYEGGSLIRGSTRGNGFIGEDVTHNVKTFKNIPLTIPYQGKLTVVGEAIIHFNDFQKINDNLPVGEKKYKTPRNLVAGSVRQQDSKNCAERDVYFHAFGIQEIEDSNEFTDSKVDRFKWLRRQGFWTIIHAYFVSDILTLKRYITDLKSIAEEFHIPIDGLVLSYDSVEYSKSLGSTSHHELHSLAFKFEDEVAETTLLDVEWSVGRSGAITPVGIFQPVLLDNTEVSRASLHNLSILEELELGIGDIITVQKCNQIIPQIQDNLTRSNTLVIPNICPSCYGSVDIEQLNDSKVLRCNNSYCPAKILGKFVHFVSRNAMNIDGLSEATLEKFIDAGLLESLADIYDLSKHEDTITKMEGFGKKSFNKLIGSIELSKKVKMENFLYALGIHHIGRSASKTISKYFKGDWWEFEAALCDDFNFTKLEDFGQVMHDNLVVWYNDCIGRPFWLGCTLIMDFEKVGETKAEGLSSLKDLSGLTFVITGSVNTFKNRDEFKELVESLSGKVSGSVSAKTNYLVSNESSSSAKSQKAQSLGVKVITESEFNEMIGRIV